MLRAHFFRTVFTLTVVLTFVAGPTATAQESWEIYDLRDLLGLLMPTNIAEVASRPQASTEMMFLPPLTQPTPQPPKRPRSVAEELMDELCGALGIHYAPLLTGVFAVQAGQDEHIQLLQLLEEVRTLYVERYAVEILLFRATAEQPTSVGDPVTPNGPLRRHRFVVARRTPTPVVLVTRHSYVSDISPVVATEAVGYAAETRSVEDGLRLSIIVGAGEEEGSRTSIQVVGNLRKVSMGKMSEAFVTPDLKTMQVELPTVSVRSIQSNIRVELGTLTVVGVLDGFEEGEQLVLAASVRKLDR